MTVTVPMRAALGFAATLYASSLAIEARAQDASPWQRDGHSAVRLLAGSRSGAVLLGGIAVKLQPGWHTYWRTPGDSGVPPRFDFSKSDNGAALAALWRAPAAHARKQPRKAGDASRRHQLRGLRKALHSRRGQCRTRFRQRR